MGESGNLSKAGSVSDKKKGEIFLKPRDGRTNGDLGRAPRQKTVSRIVEQLLQRSDGKPKEEVVRFADEPKTKSKKKNEKKLSRRR